MASVRNLAAVLLTTAALVSSGFAQTAQPAQPTAPGTSPAAPATPAPPSPAKAPDRAAAYYHYSLAHLYEELVAIYGRSEFANKALEQYKLAIENDPTSEYLNSGLAELYAKTGRIRDAVLEAQEILKRDPNNVEARKLLGRIYLRSLGDLQSGTQSQQVLKLAIEQFESIVKLEPNNVEHRLLLGRLYRINNEMAKAEQSFKAALQLQPQSEEAIANLAFLYNEQGSPQRSMELLNGVPEEARSARLYQALGITYEQQKQPKQAIEAYRKAVELDRDNLDLQRSLAQNLMEDGQYDAALDQYKQVAEADQQDAQTFLRMSEIYRRTGQLDLAVENLKRAESLVPGSVEVPYNLALVYQAQGKLDEAAGLLQKLLQDTARPETTYSTGQRNNRSVFLERLGGIYRDQGKTDLAVQTFRQMMGLGEDNAIRGYQHTIDTYRDKKDWQKASLAAKEAVEKYPKNRTLKMIYASQLADDGKPDQGLTQMRSLLKNTAEDRETYVAIAQVNSRLKRWKDAEEAIEKAEELSKKPDELMYVYFVRGSMYERQKKYDAAEEYFKKVLALDPHNAMTLNYLGYMLAERGVRLDESVGYLKRALAIEPNNGAYLDSLGWAYFRQGQYEIAEQMLRRAVEKLPQDATIHDHLADLYQRTGKLRLAITHWERALDEWGRTVATEVDQTDVAGVQKKLETARVRLAKQEQPK